MLNKQTMAKLLLFLCALVLLAARPASARGGGNKCPPAKCDWEAWERTPSCHWDDTLGRCTNTTYVHPGGATDAGQCAFGQYTFDGEGCPCGHGKVVQCACVTRARATEGLETKKQNLTIIGFCLLPAAGLVTALTWWCLRTNHKCGVRCRADQARHERDCAQCCGATTQARFWIHFGNWFTAIAFGITAVVLLVWAFGIDPKTGYWEGCGDRHE